MLWIHYTSYNESLLLSLDNKRYRSKSFILTYSRTYKVLHHLPLSLKMQRSLRNMEVQAHVELFISSIVTVESMNPIHAPYAKGVLVLCKEVSWSVKVSGSPRDFRCLFKS